MDLATPDRRVANGARHEVVSGLLPQPGGLEGFGVGEVVPHPDQASALELVDLPVMPFDGYAACCTGATLQPEADDSIILILCTGARGACGCPRAGECERSRRSCQCPPGASRLPGNWPATAESWVETTRARRPHDRDSAAPATGGVPDARASAPRRVRSVRSRATASPAACVEPDRGARGAGRDRSPTPACSATYARAAEATLVSASLASPGARGAVRTSACGASADYRSVKMPWTRGTSRRRSRARPAASFHLAGPEPHRPRQVKGKARLILQSPTVCLRHPSDRSDEVLGAELRGLQGATRGGGAMAKRSRGGLGQHGAAPDRGERTERRQPAEEVAVLDSAEALVEAAGLTNRLRANGDA